MLINNQLMNLLNYSPDTHAKPTRMMVFGWVPMRMPPFERGALSKANFYFFIFLSPDTIVCSTNSAAGLINSTLKN